MRNTISLALVPLMALFFSAACAEGGALEHDLESNGSGLKEGPLHVSRAISVDPSSVSQGEVFHASVEYLNRTMILFHLQALEISAFHPESGTKIVLEPRVGPSFLRRRERIGLEVSHSFTMHDPPGLWEIRSVFLDPNDVWHESRTAALITLLDPEAEEPVDPDPEPDPEPDPNPEPQPGSFVAAFTNARGNQWWVEVEVGSSRTIATVDARVDGGIWQALDRTTWGSWAASLFVEQDALVQFRAISSDGAQALSGSYRWPDAVLVQPGPDPVEPDPVVPDPVVPDPVEPDPVEPDPVVPGPVVPGTPGTPWLRTQGNQIVDPAGDVWIGRGFNIHDTRSCNACTWTQPNVAEVKRRIDEAVDVWGADFLRLNLEAYGASSGRVHWQNVTQDARYLADVIDIVRHIGTKPGVYVLVSLWHDPTFSSMGWPTNATIPVWELLAREMKDMSHVMYGLVNEPQHNYDGAYDSQVWTAMNNTVAAIRRVQDNQGSPRTIIAVQGTGGWARFVDYYRTNPITAGGGENVVYETHPYNSASEFYSIYERAAEVVPVIIGEFGPFASMTTSDAEQLMQRAELRGIPYLAWTFHMRCPPNLLVDHSGGGCGVGMPLVPTAWGQQLINRLRNPPARP